MMKSKLAKILIFVILGLVLIVIGVVAVRAYKAPMAPTMAVPTATKVVPTATTVATTEVPQATPAPTDVQPTPTVVTEVPTAEAVCGQTGSMTILVLGSDSYQGVPPYGADSIRFVKVDYDAQKVNIITFPRDMIVQTAVLNYLNIPQSPLGAAFKYANQYASGTDLERNSAAATVMGQIVMDDFGVHPDHYITVQMNQLAALIDTIGGVEITIPESIVTERGFAFTAGPQTLNGLGATEYIRANRPGGDNARTVRQNLFLKALQAKMISPSILPKVPGLISQFKNVVATDLSLEQFVSLACLAGKLPDNGIAFDTVNTPNLVNGVYPDVKAIKDFLAQKLGD
jgi:LCP family protein required for cell wall assembly